MTADMMLPLTVLLADDHVPFRRELKRIIQAAPDLELAGEAGDGPELFQFLQERSPDLLVLDICMPQLRAMEATRLIKRMYPKIKILIMMMGREREYLTHALAAGADGVLLKQDAAAELLRALEQIWRGGVYSPPPVKEPLSLTSATAASDDIICRDFL